MVLVEGLNVKAKRIPKKQLAPIWKSLTDKPIPNIKALIISDQDFNHIIEHHQCREDAQREIAEWGRLLSTKGTDACVFNGSRKENAEYVILIRENPYHTFEEIIPHELLHIIRGDL
ncbi:MAG: hypothetical protein ACFCUE_08930 [Candidatus Bathyarchaeia archaeon]|jgi:hypothetical protein